MDPKKRFSSRVENYIRYRPGYPAELVGLLAKECGLKAGSVVVDVGSGTGLLAVKFLESGCRVFGVEPNIEMRLAGERLLAQYSTFTSIGGSAESTGLADGSADFVTAGQSFHWFEPEAAGKELRRILRPNGWAALVWNERKTDTTPFLIAYEDLLLRFATDYIEVNHRNTEADPALIPAFFSGPFREAHFKNQQVFDFEGLRGRLLSSSYAPLPDHPNYKPMLERLEQIFNQYQINGFVTIFYDTHLYYGHLG